MPINLTFKKNGKEIKEAIANRIAQLNSRLKKRNEDLDDFMNDRTRLRSYLVRNSDAVWGMGMHGRDQPAPLFTMDDISSEEVGEIRQLCRRIFEIEQELKRLYLVKEHLKDDQEFQLPYHDLVAYGFEASMFAE
jgi:hypothetical protein